MQIVVVVCSWTVVGLLLMHYVQAYFARSQVKRRLWESSTATDILEETTDPLERSWLSRWLCLAGFRQATAPTNFVVATAGAVVLGLVIALVIQRSGLVVVARTAAGEMPGGMGAMAQPVLQVAPWLVSGMLVLLPVSFVRSARRRRVAQVERDLPITLELLATLAESGIGFDAATGRILDSQPSERALAGELRTLQAELLAGRSRVDCLRRVARRLDVISVTIFISAIVQAEQIGSGVAAVLRGQADDLRQRRRERALEFSMALPVKQLFPLVICFLPGILIFAIAPLFSEFLRYTDSFGGIGKF